MSDEEKTDDESEESGMVSGGHADRVADRLCPNRTPWPEEVSQLSRGTCSKRQNTLKGLGMRNMNLNKEYENRRNSRK